VKNSVIIADPEGKGYGFAKGVYERAKDIGGRNFALGFYDLEKIRFRDGEFKIKISKNIREHNCFYIHDSNKGAAEWFLDLGLTLEALRSSSADKVNLILPYMRFARQERKDESRVSVAAKLIADVVSLYSDRGLTVDLHAPQITQYFNRRVPFDNLYSFPELVGYLRVNQSDLLENLVVVSPDAGGADRAAYLRNRLKREGVDVGLAICHKERCNNGEIEDVIVIGNVKGKNCLMVDDIIDSGGTMVKGCSALKGQGAEKVYAYGTHGLFTEGSDGFGCLEKVIVSDTLHVEPFENLEILSLVNLFGEAVYRTIEGESLSSLFDGREKG
jgi:ribose-phosphate pyrophosphokinase